MAVTDLTQALQLLNEAMDREGFTDAPEITADNLEEMGVLPASQLSKHIDALILVLQQRTFTNVFNSEKNPWRRFFIDLSKNGFGIKDIFVEFIDGSIPMWDASYTDQQVVEDLVSYAEDKIQKKYHDTAIQNQFKASFDNREYSKIFTKEGLPRFIDAKIINLTNSAELWLQNEVLKLIKDMVDSGNVKYKTGFDMTTQEGIDGLVESVRSTVRGATLPSNLYNKEEVISISDKDDLFLISTPEIVERINVRSLSGAYNVNFANLPISLIEAPNGTSLGTDPTTSTDALIVMIDRRALVLGIRTWVMTTFNVPNTLKRNNWLSCEGIKSYNTFFNCVAFCGSFDEFTTAKNVNVVNTTESPVNTKEVPAG